MNLRTCLLILFATVSMTARAQDKIYKKDGTVIDAKVKSVATTTVTYRRFDNPDGPEYTILKTDLSRIKYENGTTDIFSKDDTKEGRHTSAKVSTSKNKLAKRYGDNIISIIPAAYTVSVDGTINDVGIGICYERLLDPRGHISFNLPVMISFSSSRDFENGSYYNSGVTGTYNNYHSYYIMPGVKFYPAGSNERVRYSIEASFFTILGTEPYAVYDNNGAAASATGNYNYVLYGFMLSNSVNIAATKHVVMAIDLGMGVPISDNRFASGTGEDLGGINGPFIQFGLKLGYRF